MKKKISLHALLMSGGLAIGLPAAGSQSLLSAEEPSAVCTSDQGCLLRQIKFERPPATGSRGLGREQREGPPPSREQDRQIEQSLKARGFDPGPVDGVIDQQTSAALRQFQRSNNLQETGLVDQATADKLGVKIKSSGGAAGDSERKRGGR